MSEKTLFDIACDMLRKTNPYKKDISEIKYTLDKTEISLISLIEEKLSVHRRGFRNYSNENLSIIYNAIHASMSEYLENYHTFFSFKQKTKLKFKQWLKDIATNYNIKSNGIENDFEAKRSELDVAISMVKKLHSRDGVTKDNLHADLDMDTRTIQKYMRRLSPDLYEGENNDISSLTGYKPFSIGGQPLYANIRVKKKKGDRKKYYYTPNTVHPIVLQENLIQVITLIKALCNSYYNDESQMSLLIAFDIWSQLSEYAKDKIKEFHTVCNEDFKDFIDVLDGDCPDDHASTYKTERDVAATEDLSERELLVLLAKVPERSATIILNNHECIKGAHITYVTNDTFVITDATTTEQELNLADIKRIDLE